MYLNRTLLFEYVVLKNKYISLTVNRTLFFLIWTPYIGHPLLYINTGITVNVTARIITVHTGRREENTLPKSDTIYGTCCTK